MGIADRFNNTKVRFSDRLPKLTMNQKDVRDAETGAVSTVNLPANYEVRIDRCLWRPDRNNRGEYFIAECEVTKSDNPQVPEGFKCSWMKGANTEWEMVDICKFLIAAAGLDPKSSEGKANIEKLNTSGKLGEFVESALEPDPENPNRKNAFKGCTLKINVNEETSKKTGEKFVKSSFDVTPKTQTKATKTA